MKNINIKSSWSFAASCLRIFVRLHDDDRGAISVLVLLTVWCLVALLAVIWNTTESAMRRQHLQAAADSAARDSATWMARGVNAISAQNLVICQDASTEAIWRAVPPTEDAIWREFPPDPAHPPRLNAELQRANEMKLRAGLDDLQTRIQDDLRNIATEYQATARAIADLLAANGANFANPQEALDMANKLRQARSAMDWTLNTYVNGNPPPPPIGGAKARPGPPGPHGEGLVQLAAAWKPVQSEPFILDYIINFINNVEIGPAAPLLPGSQRDFQITTAPAVAQNIAARMAAHETSAYHNQLVMADHDLWQRHFQDPRPGGDPISDAGLDDTPQSIEKQRSQSADFYKTDVTLATLKNSSGSSGPARVTAPLIPAAEVPPAVHLDSIRLNHFQEALDAGLTPAMVIDPINPHTEDSRIWYPPVVINVDPQLQSLYGLAPTYPFEANLPAFMADDRGWGHLWAMPLEHYLHNRVARDMQGINQAFMVPLDAARTGPLATAVHAMLNLPPDGQVKIVDLPGKLPDDQPKPLLPPLPSPPPPPIFEDIPVLPRLTAPAAADAGYRAQIDVYNQHGAAFTAHVRGLANSLRRYAAYFDYFTGPFASATWHYRVQDAKIQVLVDLGRKKQFMVLSTYGLRPLTQPGGMHDSLFITLQDILVRMNTAAISQSAADTLADNDPDGFGGGFLDASYRRTALLNHYNVQAAAIADALVRPYARRAAWEIADEWVTRPWPYEITPPSSDLAVPPTRGILPDDRMTHFTVLAAARQTSDTAPRLIQLQFNNNPIFGGDAKPLVAYAQAETFNWMEFNSSYGGRERFDEVVSIPDVTYYYGGAGVHNLVGSPRGWRTGSVGGWNWRSRLSLSDALYPALQTNSELADYLKAANINPPDKVTLDALNLH